MKRKPHSRTKRTTKSVLRLADLEYAKAAVLNSLTSLDAKRGYRHAIEEFVDWYCSEPRLAFNRIVVLRYGLILNPVSSHRAASAIQIFIQVGSWQEAINSNLASAKVAREYRATHHLGGGFNGSTQH